MVFSHYCFVQCVCDGERKRDKAHEEISKGLKLPAMADPHELEGVRSKDHARRWNIISDVDTLVA